MLEIRVQWNSQPIDQWLQRLEEELRTLAAFEESHRVLLDAEEREFSGGHLVASGDLRDSLTKQGGEHVWDIDGRGRRITFGTSVEYAQYQHEPLFDTISRDDYAEVLRLVTAAMLRGARF